MKKKIEIYRLTEDLKHLRKDHLFEEYVLDNSKDKIIAQNDFMRIYDKSYFEGKLEKIGEKETKDTVYYNTCKQNLINKKTDLTERISNLQKDLEFVDSELKKLN
jgi:hypothetical protein